MSTTKVPLTRTQFLAGLMLSLAVLPANSSLPSKRYCSEIMCMQRSVSSWTPVQDVYTYQLDDGTEHRVIRYKDGSLVSLFASPVAHGTCKENRLELVETTRGALKGEGCLRSDFQQADIAFKFSAKVTGPDARMFLNHADILIWRTGYDDDGTYHEVASEAVVFGLKRKP